MNATAPVISDSIQIRPSDSTLGAVVYGVDLASVDRRTFGRIEAAWYDYAVLVFADQHLDDAAHVAFSERFGALERSLTKHGLGPDPALIVLTNVREDGTLDPTDDEWTV
ncbi:MAG: TauD/TfdA dioxygenase family protein [Gammaproteobacteria bacterium]